MAIAFYIPPCENPTVYQLLQKLKKIKLNRYLLIQQCNQLLARLQGSDLLRQVLAQLQECDLQIRDCMLQLERQQESVQPEQLQPQQQQPSQANLQSATTSAPAPSASPAPASPSTPANNTTTAAAAAAAPSTSNNTTSSSLPPPPPPPPPSASPSSSAPSPPSASTTTTTAGRAGPPTQVLLTGMPQLGSDPPLQRLAHEIIATSPTNARCELCAELCSLLRKVC